MPDEEEAADDTVPVRRAATDVGPSGADPLIASPITATGLTGQIPRPGDQSPPWLVPALFIGFVVFIVGLVYVAQSRRGGDADSSAVAQPATSSGAPDGGTSAPIGSVGAPVAGVPGVSAGTVGVAGETSVIVAQCEAQTPFAPLNTDYEVSSYAFADGTGTIDVVDRVFDGRSETATYSGGEYEFVSIEPLGDAGAFIARFRDADSLEEIDVSVTPGTDATSTCSERVVTNEPGQFTEPTTHIILDVCADRSAAGVFVAGLTSQGSRFHVSQTGAELADIAFRSGSRGATTLRSAEPGSLLVDIGADTDVVSVSGVVTDGADTLDISIDVGTDRPLGSVRTCSDGDRL